MSRKSPWILPFYLLLSVYFSACAPTQALPQFKNTLVAIQPTPSVVVKATPVASLAVATVTMGPVVCNSQAGSLETGVIDTLLLDKPMRYTVYLPPCYSLDINMRYPVLYLLHGQGYIEDQWIRIGAVSTADRLITAGDVLPFIIVFPFDYSYKQPAEYRFEDVFIQQLIPTIDGTYRTQVAATQRAIGGLSRGGAWALHIGAGHPDLFGSIGGHSPAIFIRGENSLKRDILAIPPDQLPRIWLDAGDSDSEYEVIVPFEEFLSQKNIPHEWHKYIGWHDEKYWSAHVERYLRWYAQGWR